MFRIGLRNMLDRYHRIMNSLNEAEVDLLQVILIFVVFNNYFDGLNVLNPEMTY